MRPISVSFQNLIKHALFGRQGEVVNRVGYIRYNYNMASICSHNDLSIMNSMLRPKLMLLKPRKVVKLIHNFLYFYVVLRPNLGIFHCKFARSVNTEITEAISRPN